jgi:hypothetical protein
VRRLLLVGRYPPACCSSRLPVFVLRLLQKVNGAQCQQLSLAVLLAWLEPPSEPPSLLSSLPPLPSQHPAQGFLAIPSTRPPPPPPAQAQSPCIARQHHLQPRDTSQALVGDRGVAPPQVRRACSHTTGEEAYLQAPPPPAAALPLDVLPPGGCSRCRATTSDALALSRSTPSPRACTVLL